MGWGLGEAVEVLGPENLNGAKRKVIELLVLQSDTGAEVGTEPLGHSISVMWPTGESLLKYGS